MTTRRQEKQEIPFGDDNKKGKGKNKNNSRSLRATTRRQE
jgi:hypothetical protein